MQSEPAVLHAIEICAVQVLAQLARLGGSEGVSGRQAFYHYQGTPDPNSPSSPLRDPIRAEASADRARSGPGLVSLGQS